MTEDSLEKRLQRRILLSSVLGILTVGVVVAAMKQGLMYVSQDILNLYGLIGYHEFEGPADEPDEGERIANAPRVNSGRGVAYWEDAQGNGRVFVITPGYHLAALDAKTGYPIEGFAGNGVLDLNENHRTRDGIPLVGTIGAPNRRASRSMSIS